MEEPRILVFLNHTPFRFRKSRVDVVRSLFSLQTDRICVHDLNRDHLMFLEDKRIELDGYQNKREKSRLTSGPFAAVLISCSP